MSSSLFSKHFFAITVLAMSAIVFASGCAKKVSTSEIEGTKKSEEAGTTAVTPKEPPSSVYETIAEPPVPHPDTLQANKGRGESLGKSGEVLKAPENAAGKGITDIYFDFDRYHIRDDARESLNHNSVVLKKKDFKKLVIEGHCDERGTTDYNLALGERRAESVKKYLTTLGVNSSKISVITYGKEKPFCMEHNEDCWQQNRRAHFVLSGP